MLILHSFEVWLEVLQRDFGNSHDFIFNVCHELLFKSHCVFIIELLESWIRVLVLDELVVCVNVLTYFLRFFMVIWFSRRFKGF